MNVLIILNYNDYQSVFSLINHVKEFKILDKILVVDNASTDDSYQKLMLLESTKIKVISNENNYGYAHGNNYGIRFAIHEYQPDYLIISNPDVLFEEIAIRKMINVYSNHEKVGAVSCTMKSNSNIRCVSAWKLPKYFSCVLEQMMILTKILNYPNEYKEKNISQVETKVDALAGSFFMITPEAIKAVNFLDENTFLYYEENILAFKLKQLGYSNYLVTDTWFEHNHSVSIDKNIKSVKKKFDIAYRSRLYYCKEYLKIGKIKQLILFISYKIGLLNFFIYKKLLK